MVFRWGIIIGTERERAPLQGRDTYEILLYNSQRRANEALVTIRINFSACPGNEISFSFLMWIALVCYLGLERVMKWRPMI